MLSTIKRIVSKRSAPAPEGQQQTRERVDPATLLPVVRSNISALEDTRTELNWLKQQLLSQASAHYEQLKAIASELDDVRQQLEATSERAGELEAALRFLEGQSSGHLNLDHIEPRRAEALAVQS
jgi:uncharacterized coiled-coil DUF342 family protein